MANEKLTQLPSLSAASGNTLFYVVDVSDPTDDPTGSSKQITRDNILKNISGLTATTISATTYFNLPTYDYEIHVSTVDGNDTTGNGDLLNPVATITKALTLLTGSRKTIIVHPGTYSENVTVANTNTTISTSELTGANTLLSGTLTIGTLGSGTRISGLKMSNLVISGTAQAYISNCTVDTQVTKSSSGFVEIINSEMQCISGIQISGSGTTIINGNKNVGISVSNASAQVIVKGCNSVVTPSASAGNLSIVDCIVTALGGDGITITGALTTLTLINSQVLVTAGNNVAPISVAGIYTIINTVYDKPSSTLTGTSTNSIDYFQYINADKFITQGGTSSQYVMGDGSLSNGFTGGTVSGSTIFTNGLTANTISATTYQNLPIDPDTYVTGFTYNDNEFVIKQNNGQPDLTAIIDTVTGWTVNGDLNVTGNTTLDGLTATTISATTYQNLPVDPNYYVTAFTYNNNVFTIKQTGQSDLTALINTVTGWTVNGELTVTGNTSLQAFTGTSGTINGNLTVTGQTRANKGIYGFQGTNTGGGTYTNQWQKVCSFGNPSDEFDYGVFLIHVNSGGNTSNLNISTDVYISYKQQSGFWYVYANIINYGRTPLITDNFDILLNTSAQTVTVYHKITQDFDTPTYTYVGFTPPGLVNYGTVVGASLSGEISDAWTQKFITNGLTSAVNTGYLGIGTASPTERLDVSGNTIVSGTLSGGTMVITTQPTSGYTTTQILMRNTTTGQVEITDSTSPSIYNYGMSYAMTTFNYLT